MVAGSSGTHETCGTCDGSDGCPIASAQSPGDVAPCIHVVCIHRSKLSICDRLEQIADSLPWRIDRLECLNVAAELAPAMRRDHAFEELYIFPAFEKSGRGDAGARSVARLKEEHVADECAASEVSEVLLRIGHGGEVENPEALGFMLRALFQAMRRHIAFEREHILPLTGPIVIY